MDRITIFKQDNDHVAYFDTPIEADEILQFLGPGSLKSRGDPFVSLTGSVQIQNGEYNYVPAPLGLSFLTQLFHSFARRIASSPFLH